MYINVQKFFVHVQVLLYLIIYLIVPYLMFENIFEVHDEHHQILMILFDILNQVHLYQIMIINSDQDELEQFHLIV
jgi:hypothetical protein